MSQHLTLQHLPDGEWIKSPLSGPSGNCVEAMRAGNSVVVRDSKDPDGPQLTFTFAEWRAFVDGVETFRI
jgi:hypothetical protein